MKASGLLEPQAEDINLSFGKLIFLFIINEGMADVVKVSGK